MPDKHSLDGASSTVRRGEGTQGATGLEPAIRDAEQTGSTRDRGKPLQILIVDDNPEVCEMLQRHLCSEGFVVSCTHHGGPARNILKSGSVDLALIDLVLPGESGLSLADYAEGMGVGVILMTGYPKSMTALEGLAHRKIYKPFHLSALSAAIKEACADTRKAERIR